MAKPHEHGQKIGEVRARQLNGLLVVLTVALLTACGQASLSVEEHLERGVSFQEKGELNAASIEFRNALQQDPSSAEGRYRLGTVLLAIGDPVGAESEFSRAREHGWDPDLVRLPLMRAALSQGRYGRVMDEGRLIESFPENQVAEAMALRGLALLGIGNASEARAALTEAIERQPGLVDAHIGMAAAASRLGEGLSVVRGWAESAIESDPESAQAWGLMGDVERAEGRLPQAEEAFSRAIQLAPNPYAFHLQRAAMRLGLEDVAGAEQDVRAMRRLASGLHTTSYMEGLVHLQQGRYAEAQAAMQTSLRVAANFYPAILILGATQMAQEQWEQAEHNLRRFLAANPESDEAARLLAMIRLRDGDLERAERVLKPLLTRSPDDEMALGMMGGVHLSRGQQTEGIDHLRRLVALRPDDTSVRAALATELLRAGETHDGISEIETLIQQVPDLPQLEVDLILNLVRAREFARALESVERLRGKMPDSPLPDGLKGLVHFASGDAAQGVSALSEALELNPGDPFASDLLARHALLQGDVAEARRIYQESLDRHPDDLAVLMQLVQVESSAGDVPAMVARLETAIARHPQALQPRLLLARHHLGRGEAQRTLTVLDPVSVPLDTADAQVLDLVVQAQLVLGQHSEAARTLAQLAEREPQSADVLYRLGLAFVQIGRPDEAAVQYRRALALEPRHPHALLALSSLEFRARRLPEALALAQRLQRVAPGARDGFVMEGQIQLADGNLDEAIRAFRAGYDAAPNAVLAVTLGVVYRQAGRPAEAAEFLAQHLTEHPDEDAVRLTLAMALAEAGSKDAAALEYERFLTSHPDDVLTLNNLAVIYQERGDDRALEHAERAYALQPGNPAVADTLGWILVNHGEVDRGLDLLATARAALPDNPDVRFHHAAALAKSGQRDAARSELEGLLTNADEFSQRDEAEQLLESLR